MDSLLSQVDDLIVAIPTIGLEQIVEIPATTAPPDAMPWIGGIGIFQSTAIAIVVLGRRSATGAARRQARGALFGGAGAPRWLVEVNRVISVGDVEPIAHSAHPVSWETACLHDWFLDGVTADRQVLPLLDVGKIAAVLSSASIKI